MPKIFAVVHTRQEPEALANAVVAVECGCDGVFFINHGGMTPETLLSIATQFEPSKTGVNFLGSSLSEAFRLCGSAIPMMWSDNAPITLMAAEALAAHRKDVGFTGVHYGGVAFKYQPQPANLRKAGEEARFLVDVLTTSGDGTGIAPDLEKLAVLAEGFGSKIAVASGVTPENVVSMLPYVDHFLVATGISKDFHNLDVEKCKALVDAVRSNS
ncbi:MAG: hypothetical protein JSS66_07675 [Armatimonadetes bacterium]|nr:hypothetical protein [Armatimonadota bacterium]